MGPQGRLVESIIWDQRAHRHDKAHSKIPMSLVYGPFKYLYDLPIQTMRSFYQLSRVPDQNPCSNGIDLQRLVRCHVSPVVSER